MCTIHFTCACLIHGYFSMAQKQQESRTWCYFFNKNLKGLYIYTANQKIFFLQAFNILFKVDLN